MFRTLLSVILVAALHSGCASTGVSFQSAGLKSNSDSSSQTIGGLFAKPTGKGPFPAIVLLHTCGGVLAQVSEDWPNFFTANGYAALTVDTFGSRNAGKCPSAWYLESEAMVNDVYGALDYLARHSDIDSERIAVMGFSLGASAISFNACGKPRTNLRVNLYQASYTNACDR